VLTSPGLKDAHRRRTVGVLVDWLKDGYQNLVFAGVADAARELDVNLICFAGGVLGSELRFATTRNLIYDYAGPPVVEGLVLLAGTLGNHVGPEALARYCERYLPVPMTSVAVPLPGIPTVVVDDAEGMREAIRHLVDRHGNRRIAFIRGPAVNEQAEQRFAAYREVLMEKGIPFDEALVAPGDFQAEAGAEAVRLFVDQRKVSFQAMVGANDHMVLGAMEALQKRGIRVPQQVAVIGFDDVDEARFTTPPLTTVRQPLYEQGRQALRLLYSRLEAPKGWGEPPPARVQMKTDLIVRESCGCSSGRVELTRRSELRANKVTLEEYVALNRDELCAAFSRAVRSAAGVAEPGWEGRLVDAFLAEMIGTTRGGFAAVFERVLRRVMTVGGDVGAWHSVLTTLRRLTIPVLFHDPDRWLFAEDLCQAARVQIGEFAERAQARQKLHVDRWARTLSETSEALLASVNLSALLRTVAEQMPRFGIETCYLALFSGAARAPERASLVLEYRAGAATGPADAMAPAETFAPSEVLPARAWPRDRRWTFILEPLSFEREQFGMILMEMGPPEGIIYESLREQISSALNSARLVDQVVQEATQRQIAERDRRKSVQDLFDHMQQAIFTVGPDKRVGQEVSAYARRLFGEVPIVGTLVADLLHLDGCADVEGASRMKLWLECIVGSDELQWSISADDPIRKLVYRRPNADGTFEDRALELEYAPIYDDGAVSKIMFIVKDITEVLCLQAEVLRKDEQNRENLARVKQIAGMGPELFATFVRESKQILDRCQESTRELGDPLRRQEAIHRLFRSMHTLKGNARIFKLTALQGVAHDAEDVFQKMRDGEVSLTDDSTAQLVAKIQEVRGLLSEFERLGRQVLGLDQDDGSDGRAAAFLRGAEVVVERWRNDLFRLEEDVSGAVIFAKRDELRQKVQRFREEARSLGFASLDAAAGDLVRELELTAPEPARLLEGVERVLRTSRATRGLAVELEQADLLPYFLAECQGLLASAVERAPAGAPLSAPIDRARLLLALFESNAIAFALPTLAIGARQLRAEMVIAPPCDPLGGAIMALQDRVVDCRTLAKGVMRGEATIDLLARFQADVRAVIDGMRPPVAPTKITDLQFVKLKEQARACARRFRFRQAAKSVDAAIAAAAEHDDPVVVLSGVAEALSTQVKQYQMMRAELRARAAGHAAPPALDAVVAAVVPASPADHERLVEDLARFEVVIAADGNSGPDHAIVHVPQLRLLELGEAMQRMRAELRGNLGAGGAGAARSLADVDKAIVHLTTSSLADAFAPITQMAQALARDRGKLLRSLTLDGLDLFLPPRATQKLRDLMIHALLNAVDHGIEPPMERAAAGKAIAGQIVLRAQQDEGGTTLQLEDDGRGIDRQRIAQTAVRCGATTERAAAGLTEAEACELLFHPGLSTAEVVSDVSGRGVGMDAIRALAHELGGEAFFTSRASIGSTLTVRIPSGATPHIAATALVA
jgi:chemotaxis protein histidine kinase CheA/DNA-binding LacI/PurR family transcriptional regulator